MCGQPSALEVSSPDAGLSPIACAECWWCSDQTETFVPIVLPTVLAPPRLVARLHPPPATLTLPTAVLRPSSTLPESPLLAASPTLGWRLELLPAALPVVCVYCVCVHALMQGSKLQGHVQQTPLHSVCAPWQQAAAEQNTHAHDWHTKHAPGTTFASL
eukprot:1140553-Pelagomonas_calceolata.AAC.3